ncbi:hypothetical protein PACTADRAFT_86613 [Pachysolen tannophilus NRRL Y-2460]|uniref:Endoribonuclease YSH1 n=1 Tax=Pachysolen tannophilus NRRL Y-2460 TaxID=669874 RepID=A0A1E4TRR5_PACTA|nr:hypothetical protein PACTADRAFT_86613 [Pachysolen tannophilus NRRL Y-2460]
MSSKKTDNGTSGETEQFRFFCLGGGNEVGRSCHIIQFKGKTVMLDAGVHPGYSGLSSLPFYDEFDLSTVDILLISHFHLDHAASLPFVMQHTNFKGRVFMTHPTKAIYRWLLNDFVRVTMIGDDSSGTVNSGTLYTDDDLAASFDKIETIDYHSTVEIDGIRFTAYHAGHVLGAAMFFIEIGGIKVLFTGDYSREEDRHLNIAEVPLTRPDILITESTFGTATHENRIEKETKFTNLIHSTLLRGGRCLLPVFALGRAQELLLILDEYWKNNEDLEDINIYYASSLARKCMAVYQTYINMMNESIRKKFRDSNSNPFQFKYIKSIRNLDKFDDLNPCIVLAAPGMLQNGVSRELLERWAPDERNAVILTGYSIEGTMAKQLLMEPAQIPSFNNPDIMIPRRAGITEISFAAHVDYEQNSKFIELVNPKSIILVHGESNPMGRLKSALLSKYQKLKNTENEVKVYNPRNCDDLKLSFKGIKIAKAMGQIVESIDPIKEKQLISGVLVQKNFDLNLLKIEDLREYSGLSTCIVKERQTIRCCAGRDLIFWHLSQMFGFIDIKIDEPEEFTIEVMNCINITLETDLCTVQWTSSMVNDTIADSVIAILLSVDSSPASVKISSKQCSGHHAHEHDNKADHTENHVKAESESEDEPKIKDEETATNGIVKKEVEDSQLLQVLDFPLSLADSSIQTRIKRIKILLRAQFGDSLSLFDNEDDGENQNIATIKIGKHEAKVDIFNLTVECGSGVLKGRIENMLKRATDLVAPLSQKSRFV